MELSQFYRRSTANDMSCSTRKPKLWTLRKVSTRISLSMPRRLTRTDTFRLLLSFCFMKHYSIPLYVGFLVERLILSQVKESELNLRTVNTLVRYRVYYNSTGTELPHFYSRSWVTSDGPNCIYVMLRVWCDIVLTTSRHVYILALLQFNRNRTSPFL